MSFEELLESESYSKSHIVESGCFEAMNQKWHLLQMSDGEYLNLIEFPEKTFNLDPAH